jgi:uncharacterized membrane-anchored protein
MMSGHRGKADHASARAQVRNGPQADLGYWICMFISGTLGTVIGDFCSHNMGLDDAGASVLLSPIMAVLFLAGRGGRLLLLPFYWLAVVLISAAGTAVGDFISERNMLGLSVSTAVTGALFIAVRVIWREQSRSEREIAIAS